MILQLEDWTFDVDIVRTMEWSAAEAADHCECAYCRNFYAAVDAHYPELRPFLANFGLDIEAPDELMPYDVENKMYYDGVYAVSGRIISVGADSLKLGELSVYPSATNDLHINTNCPEPCFYLFVGTILLPWVLNEPMEEVVSPANAPSFLKKMWQNLLKRQKKQDIES